MREFFREHGLPLGPNSRLDLPEPKIIMEYQRKVSSSRKLAQQYNCSDVLDADEVLAAHHAGEDDVPMSPPPAPNFTARQGQYLAFIYAYTRVLGRPPAEADLRLHFGVTPPSVHQMVHSRTSWADPAKTWSRPQHRSPCCP
jgi:hypothetical protein